MDPLRQIAPLLGLLLALVVGGEMTDVLPCGDADCGVWSTLLDTDPSPPVGESGGSGGAVATCLCHVTFMSTEVLPATPASALGDGAAWSAHPGRTSAPDGRVPVPPPRG